MKLSWLPPFTTVLVAAILAASFFAHNQDGELDQQVATQVAHAPRHLWAGELARLFTSIPFTSDRWHLAAALVMSVLCVGSCERMRGSLATAGLFLLSHATTLSMLAACLYVGHALMDTHSSRQLLDIPMWGRQRATMVAWVWCCSSGDASRQSWSVAFIFCYLCLRIASSYFRHFEPHVFQNDLAHLIAFLVGGLMLRRVSVLGSKPSDKKIRGQKNQEARRSN